MAKILVTGSAGFIGFHLTKYLLERGDTVIGIDNINDYYDIKLKFSRLAVLGINNSAEKWNSKVQSIKYPKHQFIRMNLEDHKEIDILFMQEGFDMVCNLAAQAGVRYSIENPRTYISSNILGFLNILESCKEYNIKHLVYASSSSVYGKNKKMPLSIFDNVDHPISLYAVSKKSNELMAHAYSHLYSLPTTGLRFFTVYGPWGRPDMALFLFTKSILENKPIKIFNFGNMVRDFTYIDDVIEGVGRVLDSPPPKIKNNFNNDKPYKLYNIGNSRPVQLIEFISELEISLNKTAEKEFLPLQPGDVLHTEADVSDLESDFGYKPNTPIHYGVKAFTEWYREYFKI